MKHKRDYSHSYRDAVWPLFLRQFLPWALVILGAFTTFYLVDTRHEEKLIYAKQEQQVELSRQSLLHDVSGVINELRYLAASDSLARFISSEDARYRGEAEKAFAEFSQYIEHFDQIRWLNLKGDERLRVEHRDGVTRITPPRQLQNKSQRYYFGEAIAVPAGAIYISPLDLNVEHGKVDMPYRPTMRFATPTVDEKGQTNGLLIVNYQASQMLDKFSQSKHHGPGTLSLLNEKGFWLVDQEAEREWSFMFGRDERFQHRYPAAWKAIKSQPNDAVMSDDGLFSFASVTSVVGKKPDLSPVALRSVSLLGEEWIDNLGWIVVSHYPRGAFQTLYDEHLLFYITMLLSALSVMAFLSWKTTTALRERNRMDEQVKLHAKVMEVATNGIIIIDEHSRVVDVNKAFSDLTGYAREEVLGKDPAILASGKHGEKFYRTMRERLDSQGYWEGEIWNRHKNGQIFPEWLSITEVPSQDGKAENYIAIFSMLSEQKSTEARLRELASSDPLTGLINRNLLYDRAGQTLAHSHRSHTLTAFLFLDLDGFKQINDTLGHDAGDQVLKIVASRIKGCVRESDTVARFGGDEFMVLLPDLGAEQEAQAIAEKIRLSILDEFDLGGEVCHVGVSIGISLYPLHGSVVDDLVRFADQAMYQAKEQGKGRVVFYTPTS